MVFFSDCGDFGSVGMSRGLGVIGVCFFGFDDLLVFIRLFYNIYVFCFLVLFWVVEVYNMSFLCRNCMMIVVIRFFFIYYFLFCNFII